jgi:hypothetical protein
MGRSEIDAASVIRVASVDLIKLNSDSFGAKQKVKQIAIECETVVGCGRLLRLLDKHVKQML